MDQNKLREDIRSTLSVIGEENRTENVLEFGVKLGVSTLSDYIFFGCYADNGERCNNLH